MASFSLRNPHFPVENAREGYRLMAQRRGLHIIALGPLPTRSLVLHSCELRKRFAF